MDRYQSFGDRTERGGGDVEEGAGGGGGETRPLLVQQHPALPVLVRCLTSPWSQTWYFSLAQSCGRFFWKMRQKSNETKTWVCLWSKDTMFFLWDLLFLLVHQFFGTNTKSGFFERLMFSFCDFDFFFDKYQVWLVAFLQLYSLPCRSHSPHRLLCCDQGGANLKNLENIKFSRSCFFGCFAVLVALASLATFVSAIVREVNETWGNKARL